MLLSCLHNRFAIIMFLLCFYHNVAMCLPWNAFSGDEGMSFSVWGAIINIQIIRPFSWLGERIGKGEKVLVSGRSPDLVPIVGTKDLVESNLSLYMYIWCVQ